MEIPNNALPSIPIVGHELHKDQSDQVMKQCSPTKTATLSSYSADDVDGDAEGSSVYTDSSEAYESSDSLEEEEYCAAVDAFDHPEKKEFEDHIGCIVQVKTDDEFDDDTTDSEYNEEKRRMSKFIVQPAQAYLDLGKQDDKEESVDSSMASTTNYSPDEIPVKANKDINTEDPLGARPLHSNSFDSIVEEEEEEEGMVNICLDDQANALPSTSSSSVSSSDERSDFYYNISMVTNRSDSADTAATTPPGSPHAKTNIPTEDYHACSPQSSNVTEIPSVNIQPSSQESSPTSVYSNDTQLESPPVQTTKNMQSKPGNFSLFKSASTPVFANLPKPTKSANTAADTMWATETSGSCSPEKSETPRNSSSISSRRNSNSSVATEPSIPTRSIFGFWSSFKNPTTRRPSQSSMSSFISTTSTSSVIPTPTLKITKAPIQRPSQSYAIRQQKRMSRPQSIAQHPGHSELLLAQMEQLNSANVNDPKAQIILNLKRQTIRKSLSLHNKGDDYDWDFWAFAICDFEQASKNQPLLISNVRRGIPPSLRGMVWQLLAETKELDLEKEYMHLLKKSSPYEKMIQRDLARTFPGHTFFKDRDGLGQEGLYNVVRAYSMYDQEVGYCQGLAFIVGPLLLNMPDEEAFSVLVQLMSKHSLRGHFTPDMEGLHLRLFQFEALVAEHLPHVSRHLDQQGVGSTMYASQWFMTLFAYKFPLNLVYRIYDVLLAEGIVSIFKFSIALLKHNQAVILGLDFEHLLDFLKNGLFEKYKDDDRRLVDDAGVLDIPTRRLAQLEKDHKAQSVKEAANARVLEELQRTNAALRKQTKDLETEAAKYQHDDVEIKRQLDDSKNNLTALKEEEETLKSLVVSLKEEIKALPSKVESRSNTKFEGLCEQNATLVQRNSVLEDDLSNAELILIDMKMRYAESENEREELQRRLYEMKKLLGV